MNTVLVSVLMGIYNCEDTLAESIESILNQTHSNLELIMCDDGSTDNTYEIASEYAKKDSRIILLKNEKNLTLGPTLNNCLAVAKGKYCARMDGDDLSTPDRFEKQVAFLETHPEFDVVGSFMQIYGTDKLRVVCEYPQIDLLAKSNPCCHATIMMRTDVYREIEGYSTDPKLTRIEDVDMFWRFYLAGHKAANIQEALYIVRENQDTFKRRKAKFSFTVAAYLAKRCHEANIPLKSRLFILKPVIAAITPNELVRLYHRVKDRRKD